MLRYIIALFCCCFASLYSVDHCHLDDLKQLEGSTELVQRIYLIRHGQSMLNTPDRNGIEYVQGKSEDVILSEKGLTQAKTLAEHLIPKMRCLDLAIVSSTAVRAQQTTIPLLKKLGLEQSLLQTDERLCELTSGKWEKINKQDPTYVKEYGKWKRLSAKEKFFTPKVSSGESYEQVAHRSLAALKEVTVEHKGKTIFVFTHNMLMNAIALELTKTPLSEEPNTNLPDLHLENGDILMIEIPTGDTIEQAQVKMVIHANV